MPYKEELLHYIWKFGLYPSDSLKTTDGQRVEVIDPGMHNLHAGPDFFNAKIRIGDKLWAGDVEIHRSSDEWERHGHHTDKAYNSVILHLSEHVNMAIKSEKGQQIPQCELLVPDEVRKNADYLIYSHSSLPCKDHFSSLPEMFIRSFLGRLAIERLERKTNDIFTHLDRFHQSWDEVFYVLLTRNFGFGLNSDAFERLALSLPFKCIRRHGDSLFQVEALLFGQAGLLEESIDWEARETGRLGRTRKTEVTPEMQKKRESGDRKDDYFLQLHNEYRFLKNKYSLTPLESYLFKRMRVRPRSFPEMRIAQLAALLQSSGRLFSLVLEQEEVDDWMLLFMASPSNYWRRHYSFGKQSPESVGQLGSASRQVLLINTVAPILFAYGKKTATESYCERAIHLLESLKPERNVIVSEFNEAGIIPQNAFDTQALIQLRRAYCDPRKCLFCRIGHRLLSCKK
ncbi:DUF2851 family protein [Proteiniphilum acetatigenes]|uniref:DUF2851 family protein n=1 Tax=Proteiniphilum acetatigenes TaxID=294710 RepID=UPI00035EB3F6|nr:DUF2851 family protein [Proteiniphilum acetatigenes]SFK54018.1 Protein of unknown function [Porphyromonadaceae bacterium KH3CP3RA]